MIPLRDINRTRTVPFVNYTLIGICGVVFLFELSLGDGVDGLFQAFGVIPAGVTRTLTGESVSLTALIPLITSMFLHGGWLHLLGNSLYLYIFGDNIEDRLGHSGFFFFYILCGVGAALAEVLFRPDSTVPLIGASGAIAGVMGAYFLLFPRAKILTLIPLFVFFPMIEVPAFFFLFFWLVLQFVQASISFGADVQGGVAWFAHAGGFLVGAALLPLFLLWRRL